MVKEPSEAVTITAIESTSELAGVPEKVRELLLKVSQAGRLEPSDWVAV